MNAGSISAMISAIKRNERLRKSFQKPNRFSAKANFEGYHYNALSKEENLRIVQENKKKLKTTSRHKMIYAIFMLLFYTSLISYGMYVYLS